MKKVHIAIIVAITVLAFSNIFPNEFLIDDHAFITNWEKVRSLSSIPELLQGAVPPVHEGVYRPIRSVLYAVYYQLFGTNPFGWHLHSLVVHLASTVLVYFIVSRISHLSNLSHLGNLFPFAAAILFGLHPIHTESITYISASMEMTGVIFFFASFYLYLRGIGESRVIGGRMRMLSLLFALLAFFTYEMTLTLPLLIVLTNVILTPLSGGRISLRSFAATLLRMTRVSIPYFAIAGFYLFLRFVLLGIGAARGDYLAYSFYHTQLTMLKVYVKYLQLLIAPFNVSYLHELAPGFYSWMTKYDKLESILAQSLLDPAILLAITILAMLAILAIWSFRKRPLITFSIAWFFISLLPVSYIFPQGIALAEKYLYIPSFGFVLLIAIAMQKLKIKNQKYKSKFKILPFYTVILHFGFCILILFYGFLTYQRNLDWRDPITFWTKAATQQPKSPLAHYNLGILYGSKGELEKAVLSYEKTIALEPQFWEAHFNLGNTYLRQERRSDALEQYETVLLINTTFSPARRISELIKSYEKNTER